MYASHSYRSSCSRYDSRHTLCIQPGKHAHRDQRDKKSSTDALASGTTRIRLAVSILFRAVNISSANITHTRLAVFALAWLSNVATKISNHVSWRVVFAKQEPAVVAAISRSAAYGRRVLPDQLREVTCLC